MGLDTSHNCWHGSYSGFSIFRDAVAEAAKIHDGYVPDYDAHPHRSYMGWWDFESVPDGHAYGDILDVFFIHSDCDGWIFPYHTGRLADRLEDLVPLIEDDWRERLEQFITGLRAADYEGEIVDFH